ncbi:MAG: hypothetical protein JXR37_04570 [Kiritimatiellae bacterium]|nr:hypothetical protein [Kiritimatiellia bacterium]
MRQSYSILSLSLLATVALADVNGKMEADVRRVVDTMWQRFGTFRQAALQKEADIQKMYGAISEEIDRDVRTLRTRLEAHYNAAPRGISLLEYLPATPRLDGSVDYGAELQKALSENRVVVVPGSRDPKKPHVYGLSTGRGSGVKVTIPDGHVLIAEKNAIIRRIPSRGTLIRGGKGVRLIGLTIDGNRKAHMPEHPDCGKLDMIIRVDAGSVVQDCTVYESPGIAFATYGTHSIFWRNRAKTCGYIDLKHNARYYQGAWDKWSADGFYIRGFHNLCMDCHASDCFRFGFGTAHRQSGGTTFVSCEMKNEIWRTYGFIDSEDTNNEKPNGILQIYMKNAEGLTGMMSGLSSDNTIAFKCEAARIDYRHSDNAMIMGCTTHGDGLCLGGWSSSNSSMVRGGDNPIVINNTVNKARVSSGVSSDWSLSVVSANGKGIAAHNVLNEYEGEFGKGPGMNFQEVTAVHNKVNYGVWIKEDDHAAAAKGEGKAVDELQKRKMQSLAMQIPALMQAQGIGGRIAKIAFAEPAALFTRDLKNVGRKANWQQKANRPGKDALKPIRIGDHWDNQYGRYHGHAWYFTTFHVTGDDNHMCDRATLFFGGVDSECHVYLNGQHVGSHKGWQDPFAMDVPKKIVKWDGSATNDLAVHVYTPGGLGGIYGHVALVLSSDTASKHGARTSSAGDGSYEVDLMRNPDRNGDVLITRGAGVDNETKLIRLGGGGAVLSRTRFGPGTYHVRVKLDNSHPKYRWHSHAFVFYAHDFDEYGEIPAKERPDGVSLADGYVISFEPGNKIILGKTHAGKRAYQKLTEFIKPGPKADAEVWTMDAWKDVTIRIGQPGGKLDIYMGKLKAEGEPTCRFEMPSDFIYGFFGYRNNKWASDVWVARLAYERD